MDDDGRKSHVYRGSCLPKAGPPPPQRPAKKPSALAPRSGQGVARAMSTHHVLLRPIDVSTSSVLASINVPFAASSTSRLDYGLPAPAAYASELDDLRPRKATVYATPATRYRPQRRSWSGDPFARRAHRGGQCKTRAANGRSGDSNDGSSSDSSGGNGSIATTASCRRASIDNTLTWRGATFPWVSRFAVQN